jgi:hypothetical protein
MCILLAHRYVVLAQSSEQASFTSEIVGESRIPKVVSFLRGLRFPHTENVDRVGWDNPPN